jgi:hypothetical protein
MGSQFLLACAPTKGYADTELASEKVALVRARSAGNYFGEFVHVELTALEACRAVRATPGVTLSRFYWVNPNEIAIVTDAEPGALQRDFARTTV